MKTWLIYICLFFGSLTAQAQYSPPKDEPIRIVTFGDDLFFNHDSSGNLSLPKLIEANLIGRNYSVIVKDRSFEGLSLESAQKSMDSYLKNPDTPKPNVVVLAVGTNDIRDNKPLTYIYKQLSLLVKTLKDKEIKVVLIGFTPPPNAPKRYRKKKYKQKLAQIFKKVAAQHSIRLYPNLFDGMDDLTFYRSRGNQYYLNIRGIRYAAERIYPLVVD
jgi:acyl-CoA thioesterase-1